MTRYAMAIDLSSCIACHACSVACKVNNNLAQTVWWNRVDTDGGDYMDTARGTYPTDLHRMHYPVNCQHCSKPACVATCPTGASYQRDDGIVAIKQDDCIGCGTCITSCPYDVRTLIEDEPEYVVDFPLGDYDAPQHKAGTAEKCTFCTNRLDRGEVPACMELCPGRARHWGDMDDPNSDVATFLKDKDYERLLVEAGTEPNVYYVTAKKS
ncbi:4Fe-4S dicluster domain-containing protein [Eggerthella guodeyinii]|uniref:4Fe-4S dicluster domain-containing protein n=1 Tax=Eggerthella guodeyinii TaxID=2690837 RepID=A0A6L7IXC7_9ACTN|nr:4Fe-4S dicluster domain-containing protein [Eggerthella guodeyinii]QOS67406.1 4Fe-4S dicluster domain-containing protein [Eggerthella guodeyinii]